MVVHRVELSHACWLVRTQEGALKGCAIGALFYAEYGDIPLDQANLIDWAIASTGSRAYVHGFDAGFHGFTPLEDPPDDYTLGRADGQVTRLLVDAPYACRPAVWCWQHTEET